MLILLVSVVAASVGLAVYVYQLFANRLHYAAKIGGPKGYPILGNSIQYGTKSPSEFLLEVEKSNKECGKFYRLWIGPDLIFPISDAKLVEAILSSQKLLDKSVQYDFIRPWLGNGLLTSTGRKWHSRRKIITPTFHFKILEQFVEIFDQQSNIFVSQLKSKAVSGEDFDVFPEVTLCALDVICESAMGTKVNAQLNSDSKYVRAVKDMATVAMARSFKAFARFDFTFFFTPYWGMQDKALKILHDYTDSVIRSRRLELAKGTTTTADENENDVGMRKKVAFLDMLLQATVDGRPLNDLEVREEVDTFMFEGHDTTTSAISFLIGILGKYPDVQKKVYDEVRTVIGDDLNVSVTLSMLNQLNYVDLVIKETLRLYPSVPIFGRMLLENQEINGIVFPAGSNLAIFPYFMGRDPDYFENPLEFRPERFAVETSAEKTNPYRYVPFSAGPRNCIGQKFAVAEIKSLISKLVRHYEVLPPKQPQPERLIAELVLRPDGGVPVRLRSRVKYSAYHLVVPTISLVLANQSDSVLPYGMMVILVLLSLVIPLFLLFAFVHRKLLQFPKLAGPPEWPIVGSATEIVNLSSIEIFKLLRRYAQQYGTAYKLSFWYQYTLVFAKPDIAEKILNTQSYASKSEDYDKVAEWIGYGLLISKGEKWFKRRKVLTPGFHFKILESFVRVFNEKTDVLCRKLASYGGSEVDVFPTLKLYTLDVLCETALGYSCNAQTEDSFYPAAVEELMSILYWRFFNLFASVDTLFRFTKQYRRFHKLIGDTREFTLAIIERKRQLLKDQPDEVRQDGEDTNGKKKMALLDLLLRATVDGKPLSDDDIREEVDTFTFAGHDTTASALTFLLFNIAKYPDVQQKLFEEISSVVGSTTDLTLHTLNDLRYLDLVIKESLRLYPSVPMIARIATENTQLDDMPIPKGTCVSVDIFQMHRDPSCFDDPERFIPERFNAIKEGGNHSSFTYIPFSAGSRNCIGQKFAQYEIKIAITKLIQTFRLELPTPDMEPVLKAEIVLKPAEKLPIRFITRSSK
ncbi:uncharacterized protein LOC109401093 [Aedes albopictus]|uniref:Cytochrome n=1 Tax=Aedes albopictus TaxID=7160 RepID=A0ABM1ZBL1_AEDAL